jgi:hypothetical protein
VAKKTMTKNKEREERIEMEIICDAEGPEEMAMGWYSYLQDMASFPFQAECVAVDKKTPLKKGEKVMVMDMSGEDLCEHDMYVDIKWKDETLAIPLAQVKPLEADADTIEAVEDWHYWKAMGYEFL